MAKFGFEAPTVTDPVCDMQVTAGTDAPQAKHGGRLYYFCGAQCHKKFLDNPAKYLKPRAEPPAAKPGTIYTCPMHPQIRLNKPGNCPICGMTLEPVSAGHETGPSPELSDMTRRFWLGAALAAPVVVLEMGGHAFGATLAGVISPRTSVWLQCLLASPVVLRAGWPLLAIGKALRLRFVKLI